MGGRVKGKRLLVVLSEEERAEVAKAAEEDGLPVATFIRRVAIKAARRIVAATTQAKGKR